MTHHFLFYLAEATACLGVFSLAYRLVFSRLTHFPWNRFYLVSATLLSVIIPLVHLPVSVNDFLPAPTAHVTTFQTDSYIAPILAPPAQAPARLKRLTKEPFTPDLSWNSYTKANPPSPVG